VLISATSFVIAILLWRHIETSSSPADRFNRAVDNEDADVAERVAWEMVQSDPSNVQWWIRFTDAHSDVSDDSEQGGAASTISEGAVRQELEHVRDANTIAIESYW